MKRFVCAAILAFVAAGCENNSAGQPDTTSGSAAEGSAKADASSKKAKVAPKTARPPITWITQRVDAAEERLGESKAGRVVWKSIVTHGGLEKWFQNGPLHFRYDYRPKGDRPDHDTIQTVDTWEARARHQVTDNQEREYGWDGERGWFRPADWERPYDVRFWALTPYYFVGMPFVLADPGVNLEHEGTDTIEGEECEVVRATFGDVGISPDDFYVLYFDAESHELRALRYIVSYDPFFDDREHSPEKLMTYDGEQTVDGIRFAESYRFFMWSPDKKTDADVVTKAELGQVEFRPKTPDDHFEVPEDARIHPQDRSDGEEKKGEATKGEATKGEEEN